MSFLKKVGACVVWTATAVGDMAVSGVKSLAETAAKKIGDGSVTLSDGRTMTGSDYKDMARKIGDWQDNIKRDENGKRIFEKEKNDNDKNIISKGYKTAKDLWNADSRISSSDKVASSLKNALKNGNYKVINGVFDENTENNDSKKG